MKRMASVALQHPCTASGVSRIVVAQYWNLDDDVTYPAWPLLKNATYINGALHPGCRPVRSVVRFTPTVAFECLLKPSLKVGRPSTLGDRPPPLKASGDPSGDAARDRAAVRGERVLLR